MLPNVLNYFTHHISNQKESNDFYHEKKLVDILVDYLLTRKNVIDPDSTYLNHKRVKSGEDDTKPAFIEVLSKQKHLFTLIQLLEDRSHSKLRDCLLGYFNHASSQKQSIFIDLCLLAPFLFQNSSQIKHEILEKSKSLLDEASRLLKHEQVSSKLESELFTLSLSTWSLVMLRENKGIFESAQFSVTTFANLISILGQLKKNPNKQSLSCMEKCINHLH